MTPTELQEARKRLRMSAADLGRALLLTGRDPGRLVRHWETGTARIPGPVQVAVQLMLERPTPKPRKGAPTPIWQDLEAEGFIGVQARPEAPQAAPEPTQPPAALVELLNRPFTRRRGPR